MSLEFSMLNENIINVRKRIKDAAARAGRNPLDITLLGVSKTVEPEIMRNAFDLGLCKFGENRVQEFIRKADIINRECEWHIIGRLQTNKIKYLDQRIKLIHSLDRMDLAIALHDRGLKTGRIWDVLVEVNVAGEESKTGISPDFVKDFVSKAANLGNIRIKGLMTIAPYTLNPEDVRWVFRKLKKLSVDIDRERIQNISMEYLSMGMSNDFEIAVEEGANIVRVGSAIFGERNYLP